MDARALVPLLAHERPRFVRLARRRLPTEADAEDVVQGAMMRATERAGSLEDPARVRPWFGRIVARAVADFHRAPRRESPSASGDVDVAEDVAEDVPEPAGNACRCTLRLIGTLRPAYAEVLRLVDVEDQSPEAAATALGITSTNLHVRLHRARHALRDRVEEHCGVSSCGPCLDCTCDGSRRCGGEDLPESRTR